VAAVLVAPVTVPYVQNRQLVGERQFSEVHFYSATPLDYLSANSRNVMWRWMRGPDMPERQLFPGAMALILAIIGLCRPFSRLRLAYAAALAVAFDLSLGFHGILYSSLYAFVFPYRGLRVPARASIFVGFSLALFAAWGVRRIAARVPFPKWFVPGVLSVMVLLEYRSSIELESIWKQPPSAYDRIEPSAVIAEFPTASDETIGWFDTKYMYFSTFHWRRLVNGNSGFFPPSYFTFVREMRSFPSVESLTYLKNKQVDYLIVQGAFIEPDVYKAVTATLDSSSTVTMVQRFKWEGREGSVYRLAWHK
jgi:hypothetical protein